MDQPVPNVTDEDVARVIRRDVPAASQAGVAVALRQYAESDGPVPVPRVHLAILKLSAGVPAGVGEYVKVARRDYRDVLAPAEYPRYVAQGGFRSEAERRKVIAADWAEYKCWLDRK